MYTAATEIYTYWHTLSLPAALPIFLVAGVSDSVRLYRNNGNMTFTASTATSFGPASGSGPDGWQSAKPRADVADFDNDGRLDIIKTQFPSRSEEHTSELQSLMRISYAVFCLKKKNMSVINTKILHKQQ